MSPQKNAMWFKTILRREAAQPERLQLFNEAFLQRLSRLSLQAQQTLRGRPSIGDHLSRRQLPTTIFSDHRPYSAGDDYRYVDWNAYAHQDEMFIKLGEIEQNVTIHLLLDMSRSMDWGKPKKLHSMLQLGAALGYLALTHHDRLIVQPFGSSLMRPFGPSHGTTRIVDLLRFLEAQPLTQQTALQPTLNRYAAQHGNGGLLILCSDLLTPEGLDESLRLLTPPRWQVLVLHIIDPKELRPDTNDMLELEDAETGQRLAINLDDETLAHYHRNLNRWQEAIRHACGRRGATYAPILTSWPIEQQVVPYLRARRILW